MAKDTENIHIRLSNKQEDKVNNGKVRMKGNDSR